MNDAKCAEAVGCVVGQRDDALERQVVKMRLDASITSAEIDEQLDAVTKVQQLDAGRGMRMRESSWMLLIQMIRHWSSWMLERTNSSEVCACSETQKYGVGSWTPALMCCPCRKGGLLPPGHVLNLTKDALLDLLTFLLLYHHFFPLIHLPNNPL